MYEHPIQIVSELAEINEWKYTKPADNVILFTLEYSALQFFVTVNFDDENKLVTIFSTVLLDVAKKFHNQIYELIGRINEVCRKGFFVLVSADNLLGYRSVLELTDAAEDLEKKLAELIGEAVNGTTSYYPLFNLVMEGSSAEEAYSHRGLLMTKVKGCI